jgi:hypothetical protein
MREVGGVSAQPEASLRLQRHLRPGSRYILVMVMREDDIPVTSEWLARRLHILPPDNPRVQRFVRRQMRQFRADLQKIAPVHEQEWLIRDRFGYRLNRENPYVQVLIAEVQACLQDGMSWADFIRGH